MTPFSNAASAQTAKANPTEPNTVDPKNIAEPKTQETNTEKAKTRANIRDAKINNLVREEAVPDFWELPSALPDAPQRLYRLEESIREDLEIAQYPGRTWDYSRSSDILEVAILGAGHSGKSAAFGLRQRGISNVTIFDRRPAGSEGVWRAFARNAKLRSPKRITGGLDWGIPNLNFRRWCTACYGGEYWQSIQYIPRLLWAEYVDWYGQILSLPIQNNTDIQRITWNEVEQCFWLQATCKGVSALYKARFIIFATGMECAGGKNIPAIVKNNLPTSSYHHTMDEINFSAFKDKRVMVVGGGASAFDNALLLLKAGAAAVDLTIRRKTLPNLNRIRWSEWNGYHRHYIDLPDKDKWAYSLSELRIGQLPPAHTYYQAVNHPRFSLYTDAPIREISYDSQDSSSQDSHFQGKSCKENHGEVVGRYGNHHFRHDALICGTGFVTDIDRHTVLHELSPYVARWRDRFTPSPEEEHSELANFPYLGKSLEFIPTSSDHGYLSRCYYLSCGAAYLSGFRANLTDLQFALPRIIYDIGKQLFIEHQDEIRSDFDAYDNREY
ncbi:MAG: NAD(P)/FAD-dependent oxidoreductase [Cyanobacteria bacterium J06621_11]